MYIPTMFFGQQGCVQFAFTGSFIPNNVEIGRVTSSNEEYFYVKGELTDFAFDIIGGTTSTARLILVGGGGRSIPHNVNPGSTGDSAAGGGGAGEVIDRDFDLAPGRYFVSASRGGISGSDDGADSIFIIGQDLPLSEQQTITARGGNESNLVDGGSSGNGNAGGTGATDTAGGGGGGSTGVGNDRDGSNGGDGGSGSFIDLPWSTVVGTGIAGGGPGDGYGGSKGSYAPGISPTAFGNGGAGNGSTGGNGERGVFALFIPIGNCNTGSSESDHFEATGGATGTFVTESVQYKYHLFTQSVSPLGETSQLFQVTQGYTDEGRVMLIGGGAGSSVSASAVSQLGFHGGGAGAGGLITKHEVPLYGLNELIVGRGGGGGTWPTQGGEGENSLFKGSEYQLFSQYEAFGGAPGATSTTAADQNTTGSAGGGANIGNLGKGTHAVDIYFNTASNGGDGGSLFGGGGGGGAGGTGSQGSNTNDTGSAGEGGQGYYINEGFWSFLTGSFTTGFIGHGGGGGTRFLPGFPTQSALYTQEVNSGGGANPYYIESGSDGFVVVVYPISGSTSNSPA